MSTVVKVASESQALNTLMKLVKQLVYEKGFTRHKDPFEMFAMMHSEISEAVNAYKIGEPLENVHHELMDCIIYILHFMAFWDCDPDKTFDEVMTYNFTRPQRYNNVRGS